MAIKTTKAVVITAKGKVEIQEVPVPKLRDGYILVKTLALAVNPTDWKHVDGTVGEGLEGCRVGCDYVGIVEEVGPHITKDFKKGDRICGMTHGANLNQPEDGSFAEYIMVKGDLQMKAPVGDAEAAAFGLGTVTLGQGLYQRLGLPLPTEPAKTPFPVLIYGGSTATGILGIQFAKASGLTVVTTASPRHTEYLRSLGADAVFDYRSPTCAADIRAYTGNKLRYAWDCVSSESSAAICAGALSDDVEGGIWAGLLPVPESALTAVNPRVRSLGFTLAYTALGEAFHKFGADFPDSPADLAFSSRFSEIARGLLASGKVRTAPVEVNRGGLRGLEGVVAGMDELRHDKISGEKLVYTME